ncbi:hypothetical protein RhiirA5_446690 [Rhizophagus irregularis]|uniref:HTH CENPB-type domain-containing protein n=1 Tax=Rhizophagus irregularis TaxID=588596 RepID=A0A2N0NBK3_9GLOM|nr:hypothetical protein RhiirA5_446690 [Rhizophagus irregularis]
MLVKNALMIQIEEALILWVLKVLENGVDINDQVLHEKTIAFASLYKVENFKRRLDWWILKKT